jgi:hypothetical protein
MGRFGYKFSVYGPEELDRLIYEEDVGKLWSGTDYIGQREFPRIPDCQQAYETMYAERKFMRFCGISGWTETSCFPDLSTSSIRNIFSEQFAIDERIILAVAELNIESRIFGNSYLGGWPRLCGNDANDITHDFDLLLNISESEAASLEWGDTGSAQIWIGTGAHAKELRFTVNSC